MSDAPATGEVKFRRRNFSGPRLPADQAARQGMAARLAWTAFQSRDRAVAFLNGHDAQLGGRPIDIAIASDDGLAAVEAAIERASADANGADENPFDAAAAAHGPSSPTD